MTQTQRGHLAMLCFSALVAGSFSLGVQAANHIAPVSLNAVRFALAAAMIGVWLVLSGGLRRRDFRAPWRYVVLGGTFAIYFVLMFEGLKTAPPVSAAAVFTLTPVLAAGFGWIILGQVSGRWVLWPLLIGALGALWVIFRADLAALLRFDIGRGEFIYFLGCIAHAIYIPLVRLLNRGESAIVFTFGTLVAGGTLMLLLGLPSLVATPWTGLPGIVWITIAYVTVFATAVTFVLVQFGSLRLPPAKVMAYTYLTPSWVIVWEIALGNEPPPAIVGAGVILTIVALVMLLRDR